MVVYNRIEVDYDIAVRVAKSIISAMHQKIPPFNKDLEIFPDAIIPEGVEKGSEEHARYLFYSVSLDSMMQAEEVYRKMRKISSKSEAFKNLEKLDRNGLGRLLTPYFGESILFEELWMTNPIKTLFENSRRLKEECLGNPLELKRNTVMDTLENIARYRQYGIGKAALLLKNFVKFGIWNFHETQVPIKVDRHVMRISLGCGIINPEKYSQPIKGKLSKALQGAKEKMIRFGYFTEEDFKKGRVRVVRRDKLVTPLTKINLEVSRSQGISGIELNDGYWAIGAYSCRKNNAQYCRLSCPVQCNTRMPSDNNAAYFFIDVDKRKGLEQMTLFGF